MHELQREIYKKGFNMYSFQKHSGISRETLYKLFEGKTKRLRGETINVISRALNIDFEEMERLCTSER